MEKGREGARHAREPVCMVRTNPGGGGLARPLRQSRTRRLELAGSGSDSPGFPSRCLETRTLECRSAHQHN